MESGRFYLHDEPASLRLEVRGRLDEALVKEMLASIATARSMLNGRPLVFDLRRARPIAPGVWDQLAVLDGAETRFLTHEAQLPELKAALTRRARLVSEIRFPPLRRALCFLLRLLRPRCACSSCQPERVWSL